MEIGIVGLPMSGKTTVFNAVTRGSADVAGQSGGRGRPNIGVAKVPDGRVEAMATIFRPKKVTHAEVTYVDVPAAPEGLGKSQGISGEYLNYLQRADALAVVVRTFEDASVPHVSDSVDPIRDAETMAYEMAFADIEILDRRLSRMADSLKSAKAAERSALNKEQSLVERIRADLESGTPLRAQEVSSEEARFLEGSQLLTSKPVIFVANLGENQLPEADPLEKRLRDQVDGTRARASAVCGQLESELAQMDADDEAEFRGNLGAGESGLDRMVRLSYDVLDLITFLTVGEDEVKAWTITKGTPASQAAGKIHTDLERGFIRAEVIAYDDMERLGSIAEARKQGRLRQEGKGYVVKDGDVMNVLFNV